MNLDPSEIIVADRQRKAEIDDMFVASIARRLIQPIVLRHTDDGPTLVAGARRLLALKQLGTSPLVEGQHFLFLNDLSPDEAQIAELEENIKRADMPWRDHVRAVAKLHDLFNKRGDWNMEKTGQELSMSSSAVKHFIFVFRRLDSPALADAKNFSHAFNILQIAADRAASEAVGKIIGAGGAVFGASESPAPAASASETTGGPRPASATERATERATAPASAPAPASEARPIPAPPPADLILNTDFKSWLSAYTGPKFNLIHCDFPYGVEYQRYAFSTQITSDQYSTEGFEELLDLFLENLDKFCSYQAHLVFWFSMEFYEFTRRRLESADFFVHKHPLFWFKNDNAGIIPGRDNQYPRRVYETAFLASRGKRPLVKQLANAYACPTTSNPIHPSQKAEPMLRHFLSMLVDETTDVFDPTAGSAAALRAADSLGARTVLGLEMDPNYAQRANQATLAARQMRKAVA